jgi:4-hydroxy-4-methyl-2-oxoglutarate aldolase
MNMNRSVRVEEIEALQRIDTCTVSNAIETFQLRLRNTGFTNSSIRCMFEDWPPMVGYAATARLRTSEAPMVGGAYHNRSEWWQSILKVPAPRIAVLEDQDRPPGVGAFLGDMHAAILRALGCVGYVTDGAVREIPKVREVGLQLFAGNVAVSHAYAHTYDFGETVRVADLEIHQGDLLHGDRHGLLTVPKQIVAEIPAVAARLVQEERAVMAFCRSPEFSVDKLGQLLKGLS